MTTNMSVRVDAEVKQQAANILSDLGLDLSTAVNVFLRQVIQQQGLPFSVKKDPFYSSENQARLALSIKELEAGKGISKTIDELLAMEEPE